MNSTPRTLLSWIAVGIAIRLGWILADFMINLVIGLLLRLGS